MTRFRKSAGRYSSVGKHALKDGERSLAEHGRKDHVSVHRRLPDIHDSGAELTTKTLPFGVVGGHREGHNDTRRRWDVHGGWCVETSGNAADGGP